MALSFAGSRSARLQPAEKKRPSPLHSTSGWESRILVSHLVPDLPSPVMKNTGVLPPEAASVPTSLRVGAGSGFLPANFRRNVLPSPRTLAYARPVAPIRDGSSSLAGCGVMGFSTAAGHSGMSSVETSTRPVAVLPVEVLLVTEPDQQLSGLLFEDAPVLFGEVILPVARYPLAVERRRVFFALAPAARELLEARGLDALAGDLLAGVRIQELQQTPGLTDRLREEVLVAYLVVVVPKERRIRHSPPHRGTPAPCYLSHVFAGEDALPRGPEGVRVLAVGFTLCNLLAGELTATAQVARVVPLV